MLKRSLSLTALAVAVVLVTAACSDTVALDSADAVPEEDHTTEAEPNVESSGTAGRVIEVELTEFAIGAESFEFTPGETVEFQITNSGVVEHEFRLSNQDRVDEHVAGGHDDGDHDENAMSDEEMDTTDDHEADHEADDVFLVLAAGETGTLLFTFPDNDHDYTAAVCLIPGHYEAGMATDLSYQA